VSQILQLAEQCADGDGTRCAGGTRRFPVPPAGPDPCLVGARAGQADYFHPCFLGLVVAWLGPCDRRAAATSTETEIPSSAEDVKQPAAEPSTNPIRDPAAVGPENGALNAAGGPSVPVLPLPFGLSANDFSARSDTAASETGLRWSRLAIPWLPALGLCWLTGSALWFGLTAVRSLRFYRLLSCGSKRRAASANRSSAWRAAWECERLPEVWLAPDRICLCSGRVRLPARVCSCPAALWDRLDEEQQRTLLRHELAHFAPP